MPIYRNKRKENQPVRSNDLTEDLNNSSSSSSNNNHVTISNISENEGYNNESEEEGCTYFDEDAQPYDMENDSEEYDVDEVMKMDELFKGYGFDAENGAFQDAEDESEVVAGDENVQARDDVNLNEYESISDLTSSPQTLSKLVNELKKMKQKEFVYAEKLRK